MMRGTSRQVKKTAPEKNLPDGSLDPRNRAIDVKPAADAISTRGSKKIHTRGQGATL